MIKGNGNFFRRFFINGQFIDQFHEASTVVFNSGADMDSVAH
jgi:hypothetical protein